ncbi:MAG: hypothetical protein HOA46_06940, partial [Thiotrichales bacterium]|nr:hypothetical protein [Thiotrichales bacterium]
ADSFRRNTWIAWRRAPSSNEMILFTLSWEEWNILGICMLLLVIITYFKVTIHLTPKIHHLCVAKLSYTGVYSNFAP